MLCCSHRTMACFKLAEYEVQKCRIPVRVVMRSGFRFALAYGRPGGASEAIRTSAGGWKTPAQSEKWSRQIGVL